ncbi:MAG TPA: hypothetical protein VM689_12280 [Aliidongia sp.]|nr:hypothetical protein [Aliidongia sp.]
MTDERSTDEDDASRGPEAEEMDPDEDWVSLPEGDRIDELGDFLEWLVNAKPEDEPAIRGEITRYFDDVGHLTGSATLNQALTVALRPGITRRDRERLLLECEYLTRTDPAEIGMVGPGSREARADKLNEIFITPRQTGLVRFAVGLSAAVGAVSWRVRRASNRLSFDRDALHRFLLRNGIVYIPSFARAGAHGPYRLIEPAVAAKADDAEALKQGFQDVLKRGTPVLSPADPAIRAGLLFSQHAGLEHWLANDRDARRWSISVERGFYTIRQHFASEATGAWEPDPKRTVILQRGTSIEAVSAKLVEIVQAAHASGEA